MFWVYFLVTINSSIKNHSWKNLILYFKRTPMKEIEIWWDTYWYVVVIFSQWCLDHISNIEAIVDVPKVIELTEIMETIDITDIWCDITEIYAFLIRYVAEIFAVNKLTNLNFKESWQIVAWKYKNKKWFNIFTTFLNEWKVWEAKLNQVSRCNFV